MMTKQKIAVLCTVLLFGPQLVEAECDDIGPESRELDNRATVQTVTARDLSNFIAVLKKNHFGLGVTVIDTIPSRTAFLLEFDLPPAYIGNPVLMAGIKADLEENYPQFVLSGEFEYLNEAPEGVTGSTFVDQLVSADDFDVQYTRELLNLDAAHLRSTGRGVVIAVIDTGIDVNHPQLAGRLSPYAANVMIGGGDIADVGDGLDNDDDGIVDEMVGHGTFVAGLISLVAPDATILPIKVLNSDGVSGNWELAKGIFYSIDAGVEVINISISTTYNSELLELAVAEAKSLGIVVVAAAGNLNRCEPREFPATDNNAMGVAATNDFDVKAGFSNFHPHLDISAPGASDFTPNAPRGSIDVTRAMISSIPGGEYRIWQGTSLATPLVSGSVALIRAQHPEWSPNATTFNAIQSVIAATAIEIDILNPPYALNLGAGRINIGEAAMSGPTTPAMGDLNADGVVGIQDLVFFLDEWGKVHSSADLNGDGIVNVRDLLTLLASWGS